MTLFMKQWTNIVMNIGWVHPLAKTMSSLVANLWWNIVMDDWKLDEKSTGKWRWLQQRNSIILLQNDYKDWLINVGLRFSVGDTIPQFTISIEQDN